MNIAYTHKFTDLIAKSEGVRQNLEHMMYLMWHDNVPQPMRESVVWQDDAKEEIEEYLDSRLFFPDAAAVSDFLSRMIEASHESFKDSHEL
jgi:hypothetical protein